MPLRLATFNVENLFDRAKALNTITWAEGEPALQAFDRFNTLADHAVYTDTDKQAMLAALETLQVLEPTSAGSLRLNRNPFDAWALLRENRGDLIDHPSPATSRSWRRVAVTGSARSSFSLRRWTRPRCG
jgi:hypothetical protein